MFSNNIAVKVGYRIITVARVGDNIDWSIMDSEFDEINGGVIKCSDYAQYDLQKILCMILQYVGCDTGCYKSGEFITGSSDKIKFLNYDAAKDYKIEVI